MTPDIPEYFGATLCMLYSNIRCLAEICDRLWGAPLDFAIPLDNGNFVAPVPLLVPFGNFLDTGGRPKKDGDTTCRCMCPTWWLGYNIENIGRTCVTRTKERWHKLRDAQCFGCLLPSPEEGNCRRIRTH